MNLNFLPENEKLLLLQFRPLQRHHVEEGLAVLVPAVYELLQVGRLGVDKLGGSQHVRDKVLVAELCCDHHGVVTFKR